MTTDQAALIEILEEALQSARDGEIKGFALLLVENDDWYSVSAGCFDGCSTLAMIGGCELLKDEFKPTAKDNMNRGEIQ